MQTETHYISASQAKAQLRERAELRKAVEAFWLANGIPFPAALQSGGYAALGRHVPTFRFEDAVFTLMAEAAGLTPTWLGYAEDKFVTVSNFKVSLVRPQVTERARANGEPIARTRKLVPNPDWYHGQPLSHIRLDDGTSLVEWHKRRLIEAVPHAAIHDKSSLYRHWGGRADNYYIAYLSLFIAHGVLFEDYHGGESGEVLDGFTARVFEPTVTRLKEMFGVGPLVVALPWWPELALYPTGEWLRSWRKVDVVLQRQQRAG